MRRRISRPAWASLLGVACLLGGCQRSAREVVRAPARRLTTAARPEGAPAVSPDGRQVAFVAFGQADLDIFLCDLEFKSAPRLLVGGAGHDDHPRWSPDGQTIAFSSDRAAAAAGDAGPGFPDIWTVPAAGGEPKRLTVEAGRDAEPDWSPDGTRLVFVSDRGSRDQLWVLTLSTGAATSLTMPTAPTQEATAGRPCWAGERILFTARIGPDRNIFSIPPEGGAWQRITDGPALKDAAALSREGRLAFLSDTTSFQNICIRERDGRVITVTEEATDFDRPVWTPDGGSLVYERRAPWGLLAWSAAGGPPDTVMEARGGNFDPTWSPDGLELAYQSNLAGQDDVWRVGLADHGAAAVTSSREDDGEPDWSPVTRKIAYTGVRNGNSDIWTMDPSGIELNNLTPDPARDRTPRWTPDGRFILFVSDRLGGDDIWVMPARGGEPRRLTEAPGAKRSPTLSASADGATLIYESDQDGARALWKMALDADLNPAGPPQRLTTPAGPGDWDGRPAASGGRVVFTHSVGGNRDLYLLDLSNGQVTPLATDPEAQEDHGAWSGDGARVAAESGGNSDLWIIEAPAVEAPARGR